MFSGFSQILEKISESLEKRVTTLKSLSGRQRLIGAVSLGSVLVGIEIAEHYFQGGYLPVVRKAFMAVAFATATAACVVRTRQEQAEPTRNPLKREIPDAMQPTVPTEKDFLPPASGVFRQFMQETQVEGGNPVARAQVTAVSATTKQLKS